jgi:uncharacterized protein (DUF1330 family)
MITKSFRISDKATIHISASDKQSDLNQPLYAINWFNTKSKKLYNLYGALAFPHVKKVGGEVVFKGKVTRALSGDESLKRESLLIVKYPSADGFLDLFSQKLFLIKSLLRVKVVKDFVFGFVRMAGGKVQSTQNTKKYNGNKSYLLHILKGHSENKFSNIEYPEDINLFFDGRKAAYIGRSSDGGEVKNGPFFIDRIVIWEGDENSALKNWVESDNYPFKIKPEIDNGNYLLKRLI